MKNLDGLLTPKQLSELLQVKPSTIYEWAHMGYVPSVRLGRCLRFKPKDIERWVQARSQRGRTSRKVDVDLLTGAVPSKGLGTEDVQPLDDNSVGSN